MIGDKCPVVAGQLWVLRDRSIVRISAVGLDGSAVAEKLDRVSFQVMLTAKGTLEELRQVLEESEAALVV